MRCSHEKSFYAMKSDGSLDKLTKEYITDVKADNIPKVEIPKIDGAETIKVGVTGDLPPLDLILPDNSPAGFNTALLAEVAKRSGKNIEVVQIETGARSDKPEGLELSAPYFKDSVAHLKLKDSK